MASGRVGPCYVRAAVGWRGARSAVGGAGLAALAAAALGIAGCGGSSPSSNERSATYKVEVVRTSFPQRQRLAQHSRLVLVVRNASRKVIPDIAVSLTTGRQRTSAAAFSSYDPQSDLADHSRPVWVLDGGPVGGDTAYSNTWALGTLAAGASRRFAWRVTAVRAGTYKIHYAIAAGLDGKARARTAAGRVPRGLVTVHILTRPRPESVNARGKVVRTGP